MGWIQNILWILKGAHCSLLFWSSSTIANNIDDVITDKGGYFSRILYISIEHGKTKDELSGYLFKREYYSGIIAMNWFVANYFNGQTI